MCDSNKCYYVVYSFKVVINFEHKKVKLYLFCWLSVIFIPYRIMTFFDKMSSEQLSKQFKYSSGNINSKVTIVMIYHFRNQFSLPWNWIKKDGGENIAISLTKSVLNFQKQYLENMYFFTFWIQALSKDINYQFIMYKELRNICIYFLKRD